MKIELMELDVRDLVGVTKTTRKLASLAIGQARHSAPFQREFIYKDKQRDAVIETVTKGLPPQRHVLGGARRRRLRGDRRQQRTISVCQYVDGDFAFNRRSRVLPQPSARRAGTDPRLQADGVLVQGTDSEKLEWFKTINIAGEKLTPQELRNAVYAGPWLTDAKRYFSKTEAPPTGSAAST